MELYPHSTGICSVLVPGLATFAGILSEENKGLMTAEVRVVELLLLEVPW